MCFLDAVDRDRSFYRRRFHVFVKRYVFDFFNAWVYLPRTEEELRAVVNVYSTQGLPGCAGSVDCVHLAWGRCKFGTKFYHVGKEGFPTRSYEVVVDATKRVRACTPGFPGANNDKTISRHDFALHTLRTSLLFTGFLFMIKTGRRVSSVCRGGLYFICDGGYHKWRCMQCPFKYATSTEARLWSKRVESMRKDVECVFGILKTRFRCLKVPCMWHDASHVDNQMRFCCILHNQILEWNGTAARRQADAAWLADQFGQFDDADLGRVRRWGDDNVRCEVGYDASDLGTAVSSGPPRRAGDRAREGFVPLFDAANGETLDLVTEREDAYAVLRDALVMHFEYATQAGEVVWL